MGGCCCVRDGLERQLDPEVTISLLHRLDSCDAQVRREAASTRWRVVLTHIAYAASLLLGLVMSLFAGYIVVRVALHLLVGLFLTALLPTLAAQLRRSMVPCTHTPPFHAFPPPRHSHHRAIAPPPPPDVVICGVGQSAAFAPLSGLGTLLDCSAVVYLIPSILLGFYALPGTRDPPTQWDDDDVYLSRLAYVCLLNSLLLLLPRFCRGTLRTGAASARGRQDLDGRGGGQHGRDGAHGFVIPRGTASHRPPPSLHRHAAALLRFFSRGGWRR
jgi:hypothetical protein